MLTRVSTWLHKRNSLLFIIRESGGVLCPRTESGLSLKNDKRWMVVMPSHSHSTRALGMREVGIRDDSRDFMHGNLAGDVSQANMGKSSILRLQVNNGESPSGHSISTGPQDYTYACRSRLDVCHRGQGSSLPEVHVHVTWTANRV